MDSRVPFEALAALYAPVGQLVIAWGMIDVALSNIVSNVFVGGGRDKEAQIPRMMKRKQKFLRRCFRQISSLSAFEAEGLAIMDEIERLKAYREGIVHGYPAQYEAHTKTYSFWTLEIEEDSGNWASITHYQVGRTITLQRLLDVSTETILLAGRVVDLMKGIQEARIGQT